MRAFVAAALVLATPAVANDCPLAQAIYDQAETGFTLKFRPVTREDGLSTSNVFEMTVPGVDKRVLGDVMWGNGFSRPMGYLRYNCQADDEPVEEDNLCIRWKGIVYAVTDGKIELLPEENSPAPEQLILSNLGQRIRYSGLIEELQVEIADPPWDVFRFKGCRD